MPIGSKDKDYGQAIKESYDPAIERLRVDALINDGVDALVINSDGSINVKILGDGGGGGGISSVSVVDFPSTMEVTGTFYQTTQPVSGSVTADIGTTNGLALDSSLSTIMTDLGTINTTLGSPFQVGGSIANTSFVATQPTGSNLHVTVDSAPTTAVTGTFFQTTQPISGTVTANATLSAETTKIIGTVNIAAAQTIGVTGTFYQTTQPISGSVSVSNFPATQAVTQSTSPWVVSGTVTANAGTGTMATSLASLPVGHNIIDSGTLIVTQPTGSNLNATVVGTVALSAGTAVIGHVITDTGSTTAATQATAANLNMTDATGLSIQGAATTPGTAAVKSALIGGIYLSTPPTLTNGQQSALQLDADGTLYVTLRDPVSTVKGVQGTTALPVQNLLDSGRNQTNYYMPIQIITTSTDAVIALTAYKGGILVGATVQPAVVTSGKTYRINTITMDYTTIITTPGSCRFTLRANLTGLAVVTSPVVCIWEVGEPTGIAPVAGKKNTVILSIPDGMEFAAGTGLAVSFVGINTIGVATAVGYGKISIIGFEY